MEESEGIREETERVSLDQSNDLFKGSAESLKFS
jgi:hypothetical protein